MTEFWVLSEERRALLRNLSDVCAELLREGAIRIEDRVLSSEDLRSHFDTLLNHFTLATEHHDRNPSFLSSMVVALMAVLVDDRAMEFPIRPSPEYQAMRQQLERELQKAIPRESGVVGLLKLYLGLKHRKIVALGRTLHAGQQLTFLGVSAAGGPVFEDDDGETYRFTALTRPPKHHCDQPSELAPKQRVTMTAVEDADIAFSGGCPCDYLATGLDLNRDV